MSYHLQEEETQEQNLQQDTQEVPVEQETQQIEQPQEVKETKKEQNLRLLRLKAERADKLERENEQILLKLKELEIQKQQVQMKTDEDEFETPETKYFKKIDRELADLKEKLNSNNQQSYLAHTETRLKAEYPDIEKVLSKENMDILKMEYPELAESINSNTDIYKKAKSAYQLITKLGINVEDTFVEDKQKALKNSTKPRPLASISPQQGDSPLSRANAFANGLTDELRKQLHREMIESIKNK